MFRVALRNESKFVINILSSVWNMSTVPYGGNTRKQKSAVPDRWENYVPYGKPIPDTRFIAFKVPLRPEVAVPENDGSLFTPVNMLNSFVEDNIDVGLIIDLTFTKKYYGAEVIDRLFGGRGIAYHKIFTEGHEIPKKRHVTNFQTVVAEFLDRDPSRLVGVHCTHGLNRTGYMVCRYLIERLGWNAEKAIVAFNDARGHRQERRNYLDDLRRLGGGDGSSGGGGGGRSGGKGSSDDMSTSEPRCGAESSKASDRNQEVASRGRVWGRLGPQKMSSGGATNSEFPADHSRSNDGYYQGRRDCDYEASHRHSSHRQRPYQRPSYNQSTSRQSHDPSPSDRPVFQPYQRLDPYRVDHRKRTEISDQSSCNFRGARGRSSRGQR